MTLESKKNTLKAAGKTSKKSKSLGESMEKINSKAVEHTLKHRKIWKRVFKNAKGTIIYE